MVFYLVEPEERIPDALVFLYPYAGIGFGDAFKSRPQQAAICFRLFGGPFSRRFADCQTVVIKGGRQDENARSH